MDVQEPLLPIDEFVEEQEPTEGLDDLVPPDAASISQAVVSATDWTTETVISQINKGNIQLNPRFQRRDAWEPQRKSRFIESLILGLPIPQLVLAEAKGRRGTYIVIDGKQRLLSIRQFAADKDDEKFDQLRLSGLSIRSDLRRYTLSDLRDDPDRSADLSAFENQTIRTVVIRNWISEDFLYQVFLRLNTGSVPLSPQELRQALHPGPFVDFADEKSGESAALREILNLKKPDFRMRDTELLVRFFAFQFFGKLYTGDLKKFLDETCSELNENWEKSSESVSYLLDQFEKAYALAKEIFGREYVFRKWTEGGFERPFNRAIFDLIMYYFADPSVRALSENFKEEIADSFCKLCVGDYEFLAAIERTTKSIGATADRLGIWAATLNAILGTNLQPPLNRR